MSWVFKWQCHEIFDLYFFHKLNSSGPLINGLKWFCLKIVFAKMFEFKVRKIRLRAVFYCVESKFFDKLAL